MLAAPPARDEGDLTSALARGHPPLAAQTGKPRAFGRGGSVDDPAARPARRSLDGNRPQLHTPPMTREGCVEFGRSHSPNPITPFEIDGVCGVLVVAPRASPAWSWPPGRPPRGRRPGVLRVVVAHASSRVLGDPAGVPSGRSSRDGTDSGSANGTVSHVWRPAHQAGVRAGGCQRRRPTGQRAATRAGTDPIAAAARRSAPRDGRTASACPRASAPDEPEFRDGLGDAVEPAQANERGRRWPR
jgi:hypothetical protein